MRPLLLALLLSTALVARLSAAPVQASLYDYQVHALDGAPVDLGKYKGTVTLVVNVASHCGFTKQYTGLVKLQDEYRPRGLTLLAFPSNDFHGQEPGTPQEIMTFCSTKYHVDFPMFEKVDVKGPDKAPVYQFLTTGFPEPTWNFCKYLVGKDGKVIKEYPSKVTPEDKGLRADIDAALAAK